MLTLLIPVNRARRINLASKMFRFLLVCMMVVFSSAFKLPASLSRRDMAKAIAAAPLAALAAPAFADNQIVMYGTAKGTDLGKGMIEMCKQSALPPSSPMSSFLTDFVCSCSDGAATDKAVGRPGALVDAAGSKAGVGVGAPSNELAWGSPGASANTRGAPGDEKKDFQQAGLDRLMGK